MHARTKTLTAALGIVAITLVGSDAMTYAGTGDSLILGKLNKANKTTHVTSTGNGPALSLHSKGNRPALAVDSNAKIRKLNADTVDGRHASGLQNTVRVYTATQGESESGTMHLRLPDFPAGRYHITYAMGVVMTASGSASNPTALYCDLSGSGGDAAFDHDTNATAGTVMGVSAADVIANPTDGSWTLSCQAYRNSAGIPDFEIRDDFPARVTLTRIDKTIGGTLTTG